MHSKSNPSTTIEILSFCDKFKAYEQLGFSEERRRAFDSVDPTFDESVPETVEASDFFSVLGSVFARNARFSVNQPVPELGDENR